MIKHFLKLTSLSNKILTSQCIYKVHHMGQNTPKQYNHKWQAWQKKILYDKQYKIIAQEDANYYDQLLLPGYDQSNISDLVLQFRARKVKLAPTTLCMLIHSFIKFNVMGGQIFDQIQKQAFRLKGQYKIRSIFGALRGSIQYNRINLVNFFLDEYKATDKKFTMEQMLQLLQTINQSKFWTIQQKKKFWGDNFQRDFSDGILNIKIRPVQLLARVFDNLVQIQNKDQAVTLKLIQYMKNRKGWDQIPVFERLYSISDKYEQAQKLFDKYFQKMSQDQTILSRYNLTQLRYQTPLEIIKYVEQNPSDYYPKFRTIVPEQQNADVWNQKYEQYLKVGAVKEEQQIIRDKSKSLGFAIKQRYETLRADNIDFTKMKPQQFQEMFGSFDQAMETIKVEDAKADQKNRMQQQLLNQQSQQLNEQQQQLIGKKGKGKGKQKKQGKKQKKAQAKQ